MATRAVARRSAFAPAGRVGDLDFLTGLATFDAFDGASAMAPAFTFSFTDFFDSQTFERALAISPRLRPVATLSGMMRLASQPRMPPTTSQMMKFMRDALVAMANDAGLAQA